MALGALVLLAAANAVGPVFHLHCSLVGDTAYGAGGSTGLLAKVKALLNDDSVNIIAVMDQSAPTTVETLEYDHTNEKLFARVRTTGAESADAGQSDVTYGLLIVAG